MTCFGEGKRLPSVAEREQAAVNGRIPLAGPEWTNMPDSAAMAVVASAGTTFPAPVAGPVAFRCALEP